MRTIHDWLRRGLGLSGPARGSTRADSPPAAAGAVTLVVDLLEVSGVDRGEVAADAVVVPACWDRRVELLDCVCRSVAQRPSIHVLLLASDADVVVAEWLRRHQAAHQRATGVRFRVEIS